MLSGRVNVLRGHEIQLMAELQQVWTAPFGLVIRELPVGQPALLAWVRPSGQLLPLASPTFGASETAVVSAATIPPGLAGQTATLIAFALTPSHQVVVSATEPIQF